ncbi:hypothetical protein NUACC26_059540 [Scytonema sp. NUACC26]
MLSSLTGQIPDNSYEAGDLVCDGVYGKAQSQSRLDLTTVR